MFDTDSITGMFEDQGTVLEKSIKQVNRVSIIGSGIVVGLVIGLVPSEQTGHFVKLVKEIW